jgi:hypothetical protein
MGHFLPARRRQGRPDRRSGEQDRFARIAKIGRIGRVGSGDVGPFPIFSPSQFHHESSGSPYKYHQADVADAATHFDLEEEYDSTYSSISKS